MDGTLSQMTTVMLTPCLQKTNDTQQEHFLDRYPSLASVNTGLLLHSHYYFLFPNLFFIYFYLFFLIFILNFSLAVDFTLLFSFFLLFYLLFLYSGILPYFIYLITFSCFHTHCIVHNAYFILHL